jgi:hypothetical protein
MASEESVTDWLLAGDPAIRWQVMRDLLDEPAETWERERRLVIQKGWVAELLERRGPDGEWPKGRWTASTWTLLLLVACGIPEGHPAAPASIDRLLGRFMPAGEDVDGAFLLRRVDLCHLGFWLGLGAHFMAEDPRLPPLGRAVLSAQLAGTRCGRFGFSGAATQRAEARKPDARLESSHAPRGPGQYRCPACPASGLAHATSLARFRHLLRASLLSSPLTA